MPPPTTQSGKIVLDSLTSLSRELKFYSDGFKATRKLRSTIKEIDQIKKGVSAATQSTKDLEKQFKSVKGTVDNIKKGLDSFFKKVPGKDIAIKGASAAVNIGGLLAAGGLAIAVIQNTLIQNYINDVADKRSNILDSDLTKANGRALQALDRARIINEKVEAQKLEIQRTKDRVYGVEKEQPKIRQTANDALYETREGRKIVEGKIAEAKKQSNDALYEVRQNVSRFNSEISKINTDIAKYLGGAKDNFQQKIETTIASLQKSVEQARSDAKNASEKTISIGKLVSDIQAKIGQVLAVKAPSITDIIQQVIPSVKAAIKGDYLELKNDISILRVDKALLENADTVLASAIQNVAVNITIVDGKIDKIRNSVSAPNIPASLTRDIEALKKENLQLKPDIEKLKRDIGEQDKLNREGLEKIKDIIPMIAGIPAIVGRDIANLKNTIPTPKDITAATGTAICNSANGGCLGNALNNQTNQIKKNTDDALGKANLGANAAELTLLGIIDSKLGSQLPGGIGGKLSRIGEWLHLDRVLNIMTIGATVHNALMLSNDLGQTLLGIINNVLQLFGLKKEDGSPFDIGSVISGSIENLIKGAIGADNYTQLRETWAKANRIYQASVNILNSFQGLSSAILTGLEMTAGKVAKIGNALRNSGEVLESAYSWMNPQPKFNRVTQTLESLQNGASTIQMVTQAPLDIINATTELTTATTELTKAIKEDDNAANKGKEAPEPDKLAADKATAKLASAGKEITDTDLDPDD